MCNSGGMQDNPVIVMDGLGGAVIAWRDTRNSASGESDIYAQRLNANGQPQWIANGTAICTSPGYQSSPAIAMDGSGGAIITWDGYSTYDIYAQRIHGNGNILWNPNGVAICTNGGWQRSQQIIADDFNGAGETETEKWGGDRHRSGCHPKKELIEHGYREREKMGLAVWVEDEAGPFQTIP